MVSFNVTLIVVVLIFDLYDILNGLWKCFELYTMLSKFITIYFT